MVALWLSSSIALKYALSLLGLGWDFCVAVLFVSGLLSQHGAVLRASRQLMEREKTLPNEWVRQFPLFVASRLGPNDPRATIQTSTDTYYEAFWGLLLLALGFLVQAAAQALPERTV